jgi:lipopolysaccharide export system permease protein
MGLGNVNVSKYISVNFTKAFLTIFLPIFFIGSLVLIITLSSITSLMQVSFVEMVRIFGYKLPLIIFYSIPVSFLVAVVMTLIRLSTENELIALFSLGITSKEVMRQLWIIATLFTLVLLILSLLEMPQAKQRYKAFKAQKLSEAKINLTPSKLGQKFGNIFVYLKEKEGQKMKGIVLYTKDSNSSNRLFIAKEAEIENLNSAVTLSLIDGSGYTFDEHSLKEIDYDIMEIFHKIDSYSYDYRSVIEYWIRYSYNPRRQGQIFFFIFISLIPLLGLSIVASFSIINPRYQKNYAYPILAVTATILYSIASVLMKNGSILLITIAIVATTIIGFLLFKYRVSRFF